MVYIEINKKKYVLDLQWIEVVHDVNMSKKDVNESINNAFRDNENANYGVRLESKEDEIISLGVLPTKRPIIGFPKIHSFATSVLRSFEVEKVSGVFLFEFTSEMICDSLPQNLLLETKEFLDKSVIDTDEFKFYWGCVIQDGMVISDGELAGSLDDVVSHLKDHMAFLSDNISVYTNSYDIAKKSFSDSLVKELTLDDIEKATTSKDKIKQQLGLPIKKMVTYVVIGVVFYNGYFYVNDYVKKMELQKKIEQATSGNANNGMTQAEMIAQKNSNYMKNISNSTLFNNEAIRFSEVQKVFNRYHRDRFGWSLDYFECNPKSCHLFFEKKKGYSDIAGFQNHYSISDENKLILSKKADKINFIVNIKPLVKNTFEKEDFGKDDINKRFKSLQDNTDFFFEKSDTMNKISMLDSNFQWDFSGISRRRITPIHNDEMPQEYGEGNYSVQSERMATLSMLFDRFNSKNNYQIDDLKINLENDGIKWNAILKFKTK